MVTRPAMPGTAKEMNVIAGCRITMGRNGMERPTANIIDTACGRNASWPTTMAAPTSHQLAVCSSAHKVA